MWVVLLYMSKEVFTAFRREPFLEVPQRRDHVESRIDLIKSNKQIKKKFSYKLNETGHACLDSLENVSAPKSHSLKYEPLILRS